jgi:hypothetical protein
VKGRLNFKIDMSRSPAAQKSKFLLIAEEEINDAS